MPFKRTKGGKPIRGRGVPFFALAFVAPPPLGFPLWYYLTR